MRAFIVIFLALHIPLFVYPVIRLCGWLDAGLITTVLILIPVSMSQVISRWLLRGAKHPIAKWLRYDADFILGLSPILLIALLIAETLVIPGFVNEQNAAVGVLTITILIAAAGLIFAVWPVTRTVSFDSPRLDKPLKFVQITDVHIGSRSSRFLDQVVNEIRKVKPEFLCITGDFIDAPGVTEEELASLRRLECPIFFSIGNHERYEDLEDILARLGRLGVNVLRTQSDNPREDIQIIGIDDRDDAMQVARELGKLEVDQGRFSILMYHRPLGIQAAEKAGVDLMISGHTHNGQIYPFNLVVNRVFDHVVGMYEHGKARLYVSQGTGTWGPVMRVGTRAEITVFEIAAK
jgi:predicted MPP superfamily phosphohydrolase